MSPAHESTQTLNRTHQETEQMSLKSNIHRTILAGVSLLAALLLMGLAAGTAKADFGFSQPFDGTTLDTNGDPFTQAGGHPDTQSAGFVLNSAPNPEGGFFQVPDGQMKDVVADLPAGVVGNPQVAATCTAVQLASDPNGANCPAASQIGTIEVFIALGFSDSTALYNLKPQPGHAAQFGMNVGNFMIVLDASVRSDDYGLTLTSLNTPQLSPVTGTIPTFWGVPADHNPTISVHEAMLRMPTSCTGPMEYSLRVNSWQDPSTFIEGSFLSHDNADNPIGNTGCENVPFDPSVNSQPTTSKADSPTGLAVDISLPTDGIKNPDGVSQADLKDVKMTFPEGMAVNPSAADGLGSCSESQIALGEDQAASCPDNSKIGTVEMTTPVLSETLEGSVYQAEQDNNPFDSTLAVYINAVNEERGLDIKLAGKISPDPDTGQLTATFDDNPQLPLENMHLEFKSGSRAPLVTPSTCGTYDITTELTPWSGNAPVTQTSSFTINKGPDGGACLAGNPNQPGDSADLADRPFEPTMSSGVINPVAGSLTPFVFSLKRDDGHQEILSTTVTPPEGVTAKLAGVPRCTNKQAKLGKCPSQSQIGTTTVGAGAGPSPFYIQPPNEGKVFLTGPYKGAPLGMLIQVPAVAGPFDLGMVNVRASVEVDPRTAQLTVSSDEIPQILEGIPLRTRDIRVKVDRPGFTVAPTDCSEKQVLASVEGSHGATADLANRFQVGDCASLGFDPDLKFKATGGKKATKKNQHPGLEANLHIDQPAPFEGQTSSNISQVEVTLPKQLLLDQSSPAFTDVCTRPEYAAGNCPESSKVGTAVAHSPLLDQPLSGPVYLKTSDNQLPDLAADLGGIIDIDLFGRIDQDNSRIRNTFDIVPDVPVSDFELKLEGGADGVLVNANAGKGLCTSPKRRKINVEMSAHNGLEKSYSTMFKAKCGKKKGKKGGKRKHRNR